MPLKASPIPAEAMPGLPEGLIQNFPSGAAITLPLPFSVTQLR